MVNSITALIIPLSSSSAGPKPQPPGGTPGQPPTVDNTLPGNLPRPEHPIYYPLPPGGPPPLVDNTLPPSPDNTLPPNVDNTLPGSQPGIDNTLPGSQPGVDNTLPGSQPGVDNTLPGSQPGIDNTLPTVPPGVGDWEPVYIWGGGPGVRPPLPVPPEGETDDGQKIKYVPIWTQATGWVTIGVVLPEGPHVTPSKAKRR